MESERGQLVDKHERNWGTFVENVAASIDTVDSKPRE